MIKEAERPELPEAFLTKMRGLLGQEYELFYASDGKWLSAGRQIAPADDEIKFAGVPAGALLWLHDHTGGREERIFEVTDNNKIIWH